MKTIILLMFVTCIAINSMAITATELRQKANMAMEQDDYDLAIEYHNQAIELEPDNPEAYYFRGIFNYENIDDELALIDFNKAIELELAINDIYYYRGLVYENLGEFVKAVNDLTFFLKNISEKSELKLNKVYDSRGWCNYMLGNMTQALEDYSRVIENDPMKFGPHNIIASIYLEKKHFEKALEEYYKMLELFPAKENTIRTLMVVVKISAGDFGEAINDCTQLIQNGYTLSSVFSLRGLAYLGTNEYQLALNDANTAIENNVPTDETYYIQAKANYGLGNFQLAKNQINEALKRNPKNEIYIKNKDDIENAIKESK